MSVAQRRRPTLALCAVSRGTQNPPRSHKQKILANVPGVLAKSCMKRIMIQHVFHKQRTLRHDPSHYVVLHTEFLVYKVKVHR